jgi:ABC-type dipeptide/oligopeptide/nickel transport system permease subunit
VSAFPGLAISLTALGLALLADGINDFLNPRLRQRG